MALSKDYYINTERDGRLGTTTEADINRLFSILRERDRVAVHIHGGLVSEAGGFRAAELLHRPYLDAGAHPVFFIWESDLVSVFTRNLPEIVAEDLFKILRKRVLKHAAGKLGVGGLVPETPGATAVSDREVINELARLDLGQEPYDYVVPPLPPAPVTAAEEHALAEELASDPDFLATLDAIAAEEVAIIEAPNAVRVRASLRTLASPDVVADIVAERRGLQGEGPLGIPSVALRAGKILFRIIRRFIRKRDHGLYPTVVEEILREYYVANVGSKVWAAMKKESADTFGGGAADARGGRLFLDGLTQLLNQAPPERWPKVSLIGHSAGAVFVNNLLFEVKRRREAGQFAAAFQFENVMFEAPACTFTQCAEMLRQCGDLYRHFRIFALSDARERDDTMIPFIYLSSLLYFVSGVTEFNEEGKQEADVPLVGMQRYHDMIDVYEDADVLELRRYVAADAGRAVWAPADHGPGRRCDAHRHGDVDNDPATIASIQHILRSGIEPLPLALSEAAIVEGTDAGEPAGRRAARARIYRAFGAPPAEQAPKLQLEAAGGIDTMVRDLAAEPAPLTLDMIDVIEARLREVPKETMARVRRALLSDVTEEEFLTALARARDMLTHPERHAPILEAQLQLESTPPPLPEGFTFPGMDLDRIPINYESHQFETGGDVLRWVFVSGPASLFPPQKAPFRDPIAFAGGCAYDMREPAADRPVTVVLFADFGTGLYHSAYIAKQFHTSPSDYALHLGDVYYNGTQKEFDQYLKAPLEPILSETELFTLNSNHEMLSGAKPYFAFLDWKRGHFPIQRQEGSMYTLSNSRVQFVGIDTNHESLHRFKTNKTPGAWVRQRLAEGRAAGRINILLSADEPYEYGKEDLTNLWDDLRDIVGGDVDLWFWGNTHYCALFDRTAAIPFIGSCLGHGGYPYGTVRANKKTPAPLLFLETATRFPAWTKLRQDRGNNGYLRMTIPHTGPLAFQFIDWMGRVRCELEILRGADGHVRVQSLRQHDA